MGENIEDLKRKARKDHKCDFCGLTIKSKSIYRNCTVVDNGSVYKWKTHLSCDELAEKLNMYANGTGDGIGNSDFHDYVWEYVRDNCTEKEYETFEWEQAIAFAKYKLGIGAD